MATSLRPQLRLVCPVCGQGLSTLYRSTEATSASWVLTESSREHLGSHQ